MERSLAMLEECGKSFDALIEVIQTLKLENDLFQFRWKMVPTCHCEMVPKIATEEEGDWCVPKIATEGMGKLGDSKNGQKIFNFF